MRVLKKITGEFWWDVARTCDYATFYHTPIWQELAKRLFPGRYRDETFGAILPSGVRVIFPIVSKRRIGPLRWLESAPIGGYGGFIANGPVSPAEATQIYKQACAWSAASLYIVDNPLGSPLPDRVKPQFSLVVNETAYLVPLDADFDTVFARFSPALRKHYRNGIKNGAHIRLATSLDDYRAFYPNYRDAIDRWGRDENYGYTWYQIEQVYHLSQIYPENIKLWLIMLNEQIVGGRIVLYWNRHVIAWNGTAHRDSFKYNVMPVAHTETIRDAIQRDSRYLDLGTSGHKDSLIQFKQRFSPVAMPLGGWLYENPIISSTRMVYHKGRNTLAALRRREVVPKLVGQSEEAPPSAIEDDA